MIILVVDDEPSICLGTERRLRQILSAEDKVFCAFSGQEALTVFMRESPDIVLTDIRMDGMNGFDLLVAMKEIRQDFASIIISAYDHFQYAQQAMRLGSEDFLVKPYTMSELKAAIQRAGRQVSQMRQKDRSSLMEELRKGIPQGMNHNPERFTRAGLAAPPDEIRILRWIPAGPLEEPLFWFFQCPTDGFALAAPDSAPLLAWTETLVGMHMGISSPGKDYQTLYAEAGRALEISTFMGMPDTVFYHKGLEDNKTFRKGTTVAFALDYIQKHTGEAVSMDDLCRELHMNYSYFSREFKRQTGKPFSQVLTRAQMEWALKQLQCGARVSEVAYAVGYQNVESFSKAFSRIYGSSPRTYLQSSADHE